ncbi:hypothetical protein BAE44_0019426 [Dichanthelium oligosanthes]|uniref:Uncharacterized protein n=1 Tax=Dichanthelium oligosanthes TaxID=888268 RepID=A0A1E5V3B3_9POAL|nr:hypothetical protein BAE44_0019426 [Dichanthelium oligosanthes]
MFHGEDERAHEMLRLLFVGLVPAMGQSTKRRLSCCRSSTVTTPMRGRTTTTVAERRVCASQRSRAQFMSATGFGAHFMFATGRGS